MDRESCIAQTEGYLTAHLGQDVFYCIVDDRGTIAACACLLVQERFYHPRHPRGLTDEVLNVYTLPAYRRLGLARSMLQACINKARELGLDVLHLKATPTGRDLYAALGFQEDGRANAPMTLRLEADAAHYERQ